ncbi:MAG: hypothetical protein KY466_00400 [Gemmatimonadetes bacterium]|nr:hypothetical protein [Gemmatimonadota bacterium]
MRTLGHLLAVVLLAMLPACGEGGDVILTERRDSAGGVIVENRGSDRPLAWHFEPVLRLGGASEGPESFYRVGPGVAAVDGGGRIHVLDEESHRVVVFDSSGDHLRTLGRKGGGPGELEFPSSLAVTPEGVVGVFDHSRRGIVRWDGSGDQLPMQAMPGFYMGPAFAFTPRGTVLLVVDTAGPEHPVLLRVGEDTIRIVVHDQPSMTLHRYESCPIAMNLPPLFHPELSWAAMPDGSVVVHRGAAYRLDLYQGDVLVESWRRDVAPVPTTAVLARRELGDGMTITWSSGKCTIDPEEMIAARGVAPTVPAVRGLAVAPDGTVWAHRGGPEEEPRATDVFDSTGLYVGTLPPETPFPLAFTPWGDVVAAERDELDVERLVVYRVVRNTDLPPQP